jgi:hypothetical protein
VIKDRDVHEKKKLIFLTALQDFANTANLIDLWASYLFAACFHPPLPGRHFALTDSHSTLNF